MRLFLDFIVFFILFGCVYIEQILLHDENILHAIFLLKKSNGPGGREAGGQTQTTGHMTKLSYAETPFPAPQQQGHRATQLQ